MNSLQMKLFKFLNQMPFQSQNSAQKFITLTIYSTAIISYIIAFFIGKFSICVYTTLAAMIICIIVAVPGGWSWWKQPPLKFAQKPTKTSKQHQE